jgi:hypothetical protein
MLQTSVDLWYVSLSVALLVLIGFISYVLFMLGKLLSDSRQTIGEVNHKLEMLDETINLANDSLRMANESLRNVLQLTDSVVEVASEAGGEIKKVVQSLTGLTGMLSGLVSVVNKVKGKK